MYHSELEKSTCSGDSGGPVMFQSQNRYHLIGEPLLDL